MDINVVLEEIDKFKEELRESKTEEDKEPIEACCIVLVILKQRLKLKQIQLIQGE